MLKRCYIYQKLNIFLSLTLAQWNKTPFYIWSYCLILLPVHATKVHQTMTESIAWHLDVTTHHNNKAWLEVTQAKNSGKSTLMNDNCHFISYPSTLLLAWWENCKHADFPVNIIMFFQSNIWYNLFWNWKYVMKRMT